MKQLASNYSISGSAVTLTGVNVPLAQILLVSDATTGNVLYSMAGPAASSYTQGANSVITLASAPGASDKLTIYYDDGVAPANAPTSVSVSNFPSSTSLSGGTVSLSGGSVTLTNPTTGTPTLGAAVSIAGGQNVGISSLPAVSGTVSLAGGNATAVKVDGSAVTQPVSLASVPSHPVTNAGTFAVQPSAGDLTSGSQTTKIVNGSNTLAIDSLGAATMNNPPLTSYSYTASGAVSVNTILIGPIASSSLRMLSVQVISLGAGGAIQAELSNDNSNWIFTNYYNITGATTGSGNFNTSSNIATFGFAYVRLRLSTAITSGNTNIQVTGSQNDLIRNIGQFNIAGATTSIGVTATPSTISNSTNPQITGTAATGTAGLVTLSPTPYRMLIIQNTATSGTLYVGFLAAANCTTSSFALSAGQGFEFPIIPQAPLYLLGSTSGVTYSILSA
jgi:hypothetical protein